MGADAVLAEVRRVAGVFAVALALSALVQAQGKPDPFVGTWKLNVDNSVFEPGPPPISRTITIVAVDNGMTHEIDSMIPLSGMTKTAVNFSYTAKFDGTDAPVMGTSNLETVSLKRVDSRTIERTGKTRGMVTETCTMKLSPDGKHLTLVIKGSGEFAYSSTQVFDRQAGPK